MSFQLQQGSIPLLVSMPHLSPVLPPALLGDYLPRALAAEDTDWHLDRLYDWLPATGASLLRPAVSRYVIDLNRPPDDAPMYPGASNTGLCPTRFFTGDALYREGCEPQAQERLRRRQRYWQPYHDALAGELVRLKAIHGFVLLWDAHSIRAEIPWLFEGRLPDLNIGSAAGAAARASIADAVSAAAARHGGFSHVLDGRFKGGYITRHYGRPEVQVHAVQLEMVQCLYMREVPPYDFDEALAARVRPVLRKMMDAALAAARSLM